MLPDTTAGSSSSNSSSSSSNSFLPPSTTSTKVISAAAEELSALIEELWPFGSDAITGRNSSSSRSQHWHPYISYPDGIHLFVPSDPRHWAVTRQQEPNFLESLTAAASAAASAAAINAASDLSDSDVSDLAADVGAGWPSEGDASGAAAAGAAAEPGADKLRPTQRFVGFLLQQLDDYISKLQQQMQLEEAEAAAAAAAGGPVVAAAAVPMPPSALSSTASSGSDNGSNNGSRSYYGLSDGKSSSGGRWADLQIGPPAAESSPSSADGDDDESSVAGGGSRRADVLPEYDIVFVHGIRGGPYVTWRKGGLPSMPGSRPLTHESCWPTAWLAKDVPGARLITVEYYVSGKQGILWAVWVLWVLVCLRDGR